MRLRILDVNTPWFWMTLFFNRHSYGKPKLELALWSPHTWQRWWLHIWKWEEIPSEQGAYVVRNPVNHNFEAL